METQYLLVLCLVIYSEYRANGKFLKGKLQTDSDWKFLSRFCFLSEKGNFTYQISYPKRYGSQSLLLYYDGKDQWQSVYPGTDKTCDQKYAVLDPKNNQEIGLTDSINSQCSIVNSSGEEYYVCDNYRSFVSSRERWWYIVLSKCKTNEVKGMYLEYEIHMTNGVKEDYLHREYSADEFYITPMAIAFLLANCVLMALAIICSYFLHVRYLFHATYKIFMFSLASWIFYLLLWSIGYGNYGKDGLEEKLRHVKTAGRVFEGLSQISFILLLVLMAKGYTITRGRLTNISTVKVAIFFTLYVIAYAVLIIWEPFFFDPGKVLYIYQSPPGYGLIAMRIIGWMMFLYSFIFTIKHYPRKKLFFIPFFIFYTLWFFASPIVNLLAVLAMAEWTREKTVFGVETFVVFCGHTFFLILTRPAAANKNFPYHVRTTQIGFIVESEQNAEGSDLGEFADNPYAVSSDSSSNSSGGPDLSYFLVSKERSKVSETGSYVPQNNDK
ncbi:hypothetical protein CHS0354_015920 [Potamilus streckersoni]|uniref:Intimal thickness related receptor IRP domain-containing protein n=1 Tax=Potamilus streckersoni TaxID=2493646 RepID=A0AAE0SR51_9BIVA|nr:hypothetical protein CHS0354_015920 [Potamilus streckersoni]